MQDLAQQRCFNHALREAAARCPECERCFCRECVTEHEDRVICAACLRKVAALPFTRRSGFIAVVRAGQLLVGLATVWLFFYLLGEVLVSLPDSFHEGSVWKASWLNEE